MKTKIFSLVLLTTILIATVSALSMSVSTSGDLTKSVNSTTLTLKNNEAFNITVKTLTIPSAISDGTNSVAITYSQTIPLAIASNSEKTITLTRGDIPSGFKLGVFSGGISVYAEKDGEPSVNDTKTASLNIANDFCKYGEVGPLEITELKDRTLDNEDEWIWHPFDDVEFSVEAYNDFEDKKSIKIVYELRDSNGKKVDLGDAANDQSVSIKDGDSERVAFALKVPADIDNGDYNLFIKAYLKSDESKGCIDTSSEFDETYYQKVTIDRKEEMAVIVDMDKLEIPETTQCGDTVSISARVYNTGTEDEDKVKVNLYNKDLKIDLNEVVNNLDAGESAVVDFSFQIPENIAAKTYTFSFITYYEYDEDNDEYDSNSKDDLDEDFSFGLEVDCVKESIAGAAITAELESAAVAGEQLLIKGTIKNTGAEDTNYSLSAMGYNSWAVLNSIDPSTITLKTGESKDFTVSLNINRDVVEEQFLTIKASYNGKTTEQEVSVAVEAAQGISGITGAAIAENIKKNWFIWTIVVINIILIIAIIAVARRIVKSR